MLSIARALMTNSKVLLFDEPTEGLAPNIVSDLAPLFEELMGEGFSIILVEQNISFVEKMSSEFFVLGKGQIQWWGPKPEPLAVRMKSYIIGWGSSLSVEKILQ
ncbi:MAG: hypothetical protein CM1200mP4_5320 [Rhodospirillaceae bacterium]|nr:MAG: hypothetical protein CM1200mP4_5320 [Rhodospirillaceae bacterium]